MRTPSTGSSSDVTRGSARKAGPILAGVLLLGVIAIGYGFFQHNKISLYAGLLVIVAGVLSGVVRILARNDG